MRKYFGTDGIRGEANRELTVDIALRLGYALGYYLKKKSKDKKKITVILGSDTRISGYMLRSALTAGLTSIGVQVDFVGVLPTPAVAYITKTKKADAGVMISASHNPAKDNGLKVFDSTGYKLPDEVEEEIEYFMDHQEEILTERLAGDEVGKFKYAE
ncbi:MAG: phosphoglucosamine mutase, partial [Fusobacterium necrophorum]|nr:phosphoglucosamine mutase [Fusobacterium necrophorum]